MGKEREMDTNVLKTFIAVCEYSGFSAAAKELGYTQSTVSSQIKQLEKELDVRLFDRYYHKINLTEKGVLVLQQARNILKAQAKMLDSLNSAESIEGEIRLSMSSSVCSRYFKNDFLRFHHQYPEIKVEITENGTEQMFDKLRKNETDLVFTLDRHIYDSDFIICAEQEEQVHFIVAADNPVAGCSWKLSEISQNEFVLTEQAMSYRKILNETLASQSLEIRPVLEIGNPLQICELVKNSSLLSFLPDFISEKYVKDFMITTILQEKQSFQKRLHGIAHPVKPSVQMCFAVKSPFGIKRIARLAEIFNCRQQQGICSCIQLLLPVDSLGHQ